MENTLPPPDSPLGQPSPCDDKPQYRLVNCLACAGTGRRNPGWGMQATADDRCSRCDGTTWVRERI